MWGVFDLERLSNLQQYPNTISRPLSSLGVPLLMMYQILVLLPLGFAAAQHVGREQAETHPVLEWKRCQADSTCETVTGEVTVDSNWRWVHRKAGFVSCIEWSTWTDELYDVEDPNPGLTYAEECAIEGADYERSYGVATKNDTLSQRYRTNVDFSTNYNSRLFLLESKHKYQMFTLLDNELAFDVDLSTVDCGLNSALHFVAMDPDGGMAKYPSNRAGAEYGTGYCDATCSRSARFVGGRVSTSRSDYGGRSARGHGIDFYAAFLGKRRGLDPLGNR